jgi:hypothetical protein
VQWKERIELIKYKFNFLNIFWEREINIMSKHYYAKSKKNKKAKITYNKILQISEDTK